MYIKIRNGSSGSISMKEVFVLSSSFFLENTMNDFSRCTFDTIDYDKVLVMPIERGSRVEVRDLNTDSLLFNGFIDTYGIKHVSEDGIATYSISTIGNEYLLKAKSITKVFKGKTVKDIVNEIVVKKAGGSLFLGDNNVTDVIEEVEFDGVNLLEALTKLAEITECWWNIDANRNVNFRKRGELVNNIPIETIEVYGDSISIDRKNTKYINVVEFSKYFREDKAKVERVYADGSSRKFEVTFPFASTPVVKYMNEKGVITGTAEVGMKRPKEVVSGAYEGGVDIDDDDFSEYEFPEEEDDGQSEFYYEPGDKVIYMSNSFPPLMVGNSIQVTYKPIFRQEKVYKDTAEINKHKNITEYGGEVTLVYDDIVISEVNANKIGKAVIDNNKVDTLDVSFITDKQGYSIGENITLNFEKHGAVGTFIISKIQIDKVGGEFEYLITCTQGTLEKDWSYFFAKNGINGMGTSGISGLGGLGGGNLGSLGDMANTKGDYNLPYAGRTEEPAFAPGIGVNGFGGIEIRTDDPAMSEMFQTRAWIVVVVV